MGGVTITVGVAVDNDIFGRGIEASLREDPGIAVIDLLVDGADVEVVVATPETYVVRRWSCPVLVCTDGPFETSDACVVGLLPHRNLQPSQLIPAVRAAAAGLRVGMPTAAASRLDTRSLAVLTMLADGAGTREISHQLGFSERTIKAVISAIVSDLGVRSRAQAVAVAMRKALI